MMKILIFAPRFHENMFGMVRGLLDAGHSVTVAALQPRADSSLDLKVEYVHLRTLPSVSDPSRRGRRRKRLAPPRPVDILRLFAEAKPDVVLVKHITTTALILSFVAHLWGARPVMYSNDSPRQTLGWARRYRWFSRLGLMPRHYFLTAYRPGNGVPLPDEVCLPYAVSLPAGTEQRGYSATLPLHVLCVGKLGEPRKNNLMLVRALAPALRAGRATLTIVGRLNGRTDSPVYQNLLQAIREEGVTEAVTIHADLAHSACMACYQRADLFVLPSRDEGAGMVILEALASGLPVVCSDDAGLAFCVKPGESGFTFAVDDRDDLAEKINYFLNEPEEIDRMGRQAYENILRFYTPDRFAQQFEAFVANAFDQQRLAQTQPSQKKG